MAVLSPFVPIGDVAWREQVRVAGHVRSMRLLRGDAGRALELVVYDETGGITAVFTGRDEIAGVTLGTRVELVGRAGSRRGHLALLNPSLVIAPRRTPTSESVRK